MGLLEPHRAKKDNDIPNLTKKASCKTLVYVGYRKKPLHHAFEDFFRLFLVGIASGLTVFIATSADRLSLEAVLLLLLVTSIFFIATIWYLYWFHKQEPHASEY